MNLLTIPLFVFAEYLEVFEYFGQDKNGRISTKQLRQAMRMVDLNPTDHQIQTLINEKECDGERLTANMLIVSLLPRHSYHGRAYSLSILRNR